MARLPRLTLPGWPHGVLLEGHGGGAVWRDAQDAQLLQELMATYGREHGVELHAYALLTPGLFLLLTPARTDSLPGFVQALGRKYTRCFNVRHGRQGTLWAGRYRSTVIQPDHHLLQAMVLIDGLALREQGGRAPYSSHAHYIGEKSDRLIVTPAVYWALGNTPFAREAAYAHLVHEGLPEAVRLAGLAAIRHGWVWGDEDFVAELQPGTPRRLVKGRPGRPGRVALP